MRVGTPAALHGGNLLRIRNVADIEDAHAAEPVRIGGWKRTLPMLRLYSGDDGLRGRQRGHDIAGRYGHSLGAAIQAPVERFGRHEEQMAVHGNISLTAGAQQRRAQLDLRRAVDVVKINSVVVPYKK